MEKAVAPITDGNRNLKIPMADLHERAKTRPPGYVEDVLGRAVEVTEEFYVLTPQAYADLRTKYAPRQPMRGLGDVVARVTSAVGIKPCGGCKKRQGILNSLVPYRRHQGESRADK